MKVKVGNYPSRLMCNWHSNYMNKKYEYTWPKERNWTRFERALEKVDDFVQGVYNVINRAYFDRRKQTIKVRIDPWDTWNMDGTLGHIILPMLKQLSANKHGAPYTEPDDVPEHLRPQGPKPTDGSTDSTHFERWDWIMGEMIFAFESLHNDWEDQFYSGEMDMRSVPVNYAGDEVDELDAEMWRCDKGPNDTFEIDFEGMKAYNTRVQNGFRLFGTYFTGLWD